MFAYLCFIQITYKRFLIIGGKFFCYTEYKCICLKTLCRQNLQAMIAIPIVRYVVDCHLIYNRYGIHCDYSNQYSICTFLNCHQITNVVTHIFRYFHALLAICRCLSVTHMYVMIILVHKPYYPLETQRQVQIFATAFPNITPVACMPQLPPTLSSPSVGSFACLSRIAGKRTAGNGQDPHAKRNDNIVFAGITFALSCWGQEEPPFQISASSQDIKIGPVFIRIYAEIGLFLNASLMLDLLVMKFDK